MCRTKCKGRGREDQISRKKKEKIQLQEEKTEAYERKIERGAQGVMVPKEN